MAKKKRAPKKTRETVEDVEEEEEEEEEEEGDEDDDDDDDDEDDVDLEVSERDYVMARLAAARNSLQATLDNVDECLSLFVNPDEDKAGKKREQLLDDALETVGVASRCLEVAHETVDLVDPLECEPWEDDE